MHYEDLERVRHKGAAEGASLLLGRVAAAGPEIVTFQAVTGAHHSVLLAGCDSSACVPGTFAIAYEAGEAWRLFGVYPDYEAASTKLPEGLAEASAHRRALRERLDERRLHEDALAAGEPAAKRVEEKTQAVVPTYKGAPILDESKMPANAGEILAEKIAASAVAAVNLMDSEADKSAPADDALQGKPLAKSVEKRLAVQRATGKKTEG